MVQPDSIWETHTDNSSNIFMTAKDQRRENGLLHKSADLNLLHCILITVYS